MVHSQEATSGESTDRLVSLAKKLVSLADLDPDWDTYGAEAPATPALQRAFRHMLDTWEILRPEKILPSVEGGVTLVYSSGTRGYAEIEFANDGEDLAAFKRPGLLPVIWRSADQTAEMAVKKLRQLLTSGD